MKVRKWGLRYVGLESGTVRPIPWMKFLTRSAAQATADNLNNSGFEELVRVEVFRR